MKKEVLTNHQKLRLTFPKRYYDLKLDNRVSKLKMINYSRCQSGLVQEKTTEYLFLHLILYILSCQYQQCFEIISHKRLSTHNNHIFQVLP